MAKKKKKEVIERTPQEKVTDKMSADLKAKLDIFECSKMGFDKRIIAILDDKANVIDTTENESMNTPLMLAAKNGKLKVVELLVNANCDVDKAGFFGLTALHYAVRNDHLAVTKFLCEQGKADCNIEDQAGNTPMHDASRMGNLKCVDVLLAAGADVEHTNHAGTTSFMVACLNASGALIEILLKKNVNVNAQDSNGDSALHLATAAGLDRIVGQCVAAGVDKDLENSEGKKAIDLARTAEIRKKLE